MEPLFNEYIESFYKGANDRINVIENEYENNIFTPFINKLKTNGYFEGDQKSHFINALTSAKKPYFVPVGTDKEAFVMKDVVTFPCQCVVCGVTKAKIPASAGWSCCVIDNVSIYENDEPHDYVYGWACKKHTNLLMSIYFVHHFFGSLIDELQGCQDNFDFTNYNKPVKDWKGNSKSPKQVQIVCKFRDNLKYIEEMTKIN